MSQRDLQIFNEQFFKIVQEDLEMERKASALTYKTIREGGSFMFYGILMVAVPATEESLLTAKAWSQKTFPIKTTGVA